MAWSGASQDAPPAPGSYPTLGDPFTGGVLDFGSTPAVVSGGGGGGGEDGGPIQIDAAITGFTPATIEAHEGEIAVTIANLDAFDHDFTIDELDVQLLMGPNETVEGTFEADAGEYVFYCSIPGHREAGMEGTLSVTVAVAH